MEQTSTELSQAPLIDPDRDWPRISIITPSYNQASYLETCIRSVLDQQYPNLEYIITDGGSTDGSLAIITRYTDQLAWWVSEADNGQSDAINKGFRRATGEIVAWLNSDDFYFPGTLATIATMYRQNPHASFYFGDGMRVDGFGTSISGFFPNGNVLFDQQALIFGLNYILQPATFINRAYLAQIGINTQSTSVGQEHSHLINYLDPTLHYGMDTDLWIRLACVAPPLPISVCLAATREYRTTKTASGSFPRVEELRQIMEKHANVSMSPGVLCYFLDTLHRLSLEREDIFPREFRQRIERFWQMTSKLLVRHGAQPNGFPILPNPDSTDPASQQIQKAEMWPEEQIQLLQEQLAISEADRAARLAVIERLDAQVQLQQQQLATSEADRAARLAVIERLDAQVQLQQQQLAISEADHASQLALIQAQQVILDRFPIRLLRQLKLL